MSDTLESLGYDATAERSHARLRAGVAAFVLPASLFLLVRGGLVGKLLGLVGAALGLLWVRRAARPASPPEVSRVDVTTRGLRLHSGEELREIGAGSIRSLEADEEALVVRITLADGEVIDLPPGYGKLGVTALAERLRKALALERRPHA